MLFAAFLGAVVAASSAEELGWPASLVNADGADPGRVPLRLEPEAARWRADLPGPGASTPCVQGDAVYVSCEIDTANGVVRLDPAGREVWRATVGQATPAKHRNATGANPSIVADGDRLYAHFKDTTIAALAAMDGRLLWSVDLNDRFGPLDWWWDLGASPVVTSAGVAIAIQQDGDSFVATLDRDTGETVWRADRTYQCARESDQAYTTPSVVRLGGREWIVTWGADHMTAHDASTGELAWECDGFNPGGEPMWRSIASAAIGTDVAIVPHGRGDWLAAVRLDGSAADGSRLLWRRRGVGADVPTPWIEGETVYVLDDEDRFTAVDAATGETRWSAKLPRSRAKHFASPVVVGDVLYTARDDGRVTVFRIDDGVTVLSVGEFDEPIVATPVLWNNDLLIRTRQRLYRFAREQ